MERWRNGIREKQACTYKRYKNTQRNENETTNGGRGKGRQERQVYEKKGRRKESVIIRQEGEEEQRKGDAVNEGGRKKEKVRIRKNNVDVEKARKDKSVNGGGRRKGRRIRKECSGRCEGSRGWSRR